MTDEEIVGIRMTTPGDIKAFARAIEQKVRTEMAMVTINNKHYNLSAIVRIYDRQVFFSDGKSETMTEPELQELLGWLFNERTPLEKMIDETRADLELKPKKKAKK